MLVKRFFFVKDGLAFETGEWFILMFLTIMIACRHDTEDKTISFTLHMHYIRSACRLK
jgi:hypothetical protein